MEYQNNLNAIIKDNSIQVVLIFHVSLFSMLWAVGILSSVTHFYTPGMMSFCLSIHMLARLSITFHYFVEFTSNVLLKFL